MPKVSDIMQAAARGAKQGSRESFVILRKGSETAALKEGLIQDLHVDNSSLIDRQEPATALWTLIFVPT